MKDENLLKKLKAKDEYKILILNAPDEYMNRFGNLFYQTAPDPMLASSYDFVQVFVRNKAEVDTLAPEAIAAVKYDGVFWISYPKQTSAIKTDINRDKGWDTLTAAGLEGIAQVAIDTTWSATRFRPKEKVANGTGRIRNRTV